MFNFDIVPFVARAESNQNAAPIPFSVSSSFLNSWTKISVTLRVASNCNSRSRLGGRHDVLAATDSRRMQSTLQMVWPSYWV